MRIEQNYLQMLLGRGSGKLHTGRRVCLVIAFQIAQEWIGIAGVSPLYLPYPMLVASVATRLQD
jgi:hypothetical protein